MGKTHGSSRTLASLPQVLEIVGATQLTLRQSPPQTKGYSCTHTTTVSQAVGDYLMGMDQCYHSIRWHNTMGYIRTPFPDLWAAACGSSITILKCKIENGARKSISHKRVQDPRLSSFPCPSSSCQPRSSHLQPLLLASRGLRLPASL
jgi:hypothetical protein